MDRKVGPHLTPRDSAAGAQVVEHVWREIETGRLGPGHRLPPERELAQKMGVSRPSLRSGLRDDAMTNTTPDWSSQWQNIGAIQGADHIWSDHADGCRKSGLIARGPAFYTGRGALACGPATRPRPKPK